MKGLKIKAKWHMRSYIVVSWEKETFPEYKGLNPDPYHVWQYLSFTKQYLQNFSLTSPP
jgi:hypothetical protein